VEIGALNENVKSLGRDADLVGALLADDMTIVL
jgi:hypothetical protein